MTRKEVEAFLSNVEAFRQLHCNPANREGWLSRAEWNREFHRVMSKEKDLIGFLGPRVGLHEAKNLLFSVRSFLLEHQKPIALLKEGRTPRKNLLMDLKNAFDDKELQDLYAEIRRAAGAETGATKKRKRRPPQIRLSKDGSTAKIGDETYRLNGRHAPAFLRTLIAKRGQRVLATEFAKLGIRADREWKKLPLPIRERISKPGRGSSGYIYE